MIVERARELRDIIENVFQSVDDEIALTAIELYPEWNGSMEYEVDSRVRFCDVLYRCITAHTAQETWNPADSPSLWTRVLIPDPEVIPEWIQPDSTNPYMIGDKVMHNGYTWVSLVDNNIWEPTDGVPTLWEKQ